MKSIAVDLDIEEALRDIEIDRDTLNIPGTPPIVETIFGKIDGSTIFVPDLSFVGKRLDGRPTPNPNVLIEYGWALKVLGHGRMLPIMNTAFGRPDGDSMPFDMRHLRHPLQYECPAGIDDDARAAARNKLAIALTSALTAIIKGAKIESSAPESLTIEQFEPRKALTGAGRFRENGKSIGISDDFMSKAEEVFLVGGPAHWLRVMPTSKVDKTWSLTELRKAAFSNSIILPLSSSSGGGSFGFLRAEDGVGIYAPIYSKRTTTMWVVFIFTNGEIWSCDTHIVAATGENEPGHIYVNRQDLARNLKDYADCMLRLGVSPPFRWEVGFEDVKNRGIFLPNDIFNRPRGASVSNVITADGTYYPDDDPMKTLEPFFSKIYDVCGVNNIN